MTTPSPTKGGVRACLLGMGGPYAHAHDAVDALDNLAAWCNQLDAEGRRLMAATLCDLLGDPDAVVRTGATLGLASLPAVVDPDAVLVAIEQHCDLLDQPPLGFCAAWKPTILADAVLVVATTAHPHHSPIIEAWLDQPPGGATREQLGVALARSLPTILLWEPRRWFDTRHTGVLVTFPLHWQRRSFAWALAPWRPPADERVRVAAGTLGWAAGDVAPLLEAMSGRAVPGSRPEGFVAEVASADRWWIVDEAPYDWSLWRHENGTVALEVLLPGWGMTCRSRPLNANEVATYRSAGATSLADLVEELRRA